MKVFAQALSILLIAGCSTTGYELKEKPGGVHSYIADAEYRAVFRRIFQASKKCYEDGERRVDANLFEDNKTAEITVAILYGGAVQALYSVEIKANSENMTDVKTYYARSLTGAWRQGAEDSEKWANGNLEVCTHKQSTLNQTSRLQSPQSEA